MSDKAIDWSKPIELTDGRKARVLCTDLGDKEKPVVVAITERDSREWVTQYSSEGKWLPSHVNCNVGIRNVPEKFERVVWCNVYEHCLTSHASVDEAESLKGYGPRIARIRVPITGHVGQFDD